MTSIRIQRLTKQFGAITALERIELELQPEELFFLLGPSGGGKSTLLRCVAGFFPPDAGEIWFGDDNVTALPPHRRNVGMMFQTYALWPHLTAAENVAFGLEERKIPRDEVRRRVAEALDSVQMGAQAGRRPTELSGGQQQRVALARALVIRPRCLLLDEPLSSVDAALREEMRTEIRRVCKECHVTTLYVTHDRKEAFAVADRIAVLDHGRILQIGTPAEIYRRPNSTRVAAVVGETDVIAGRIIHATGSAAVVETSIGRLEGVLADPANPPKPEAKISVLVRPESWVLHRDPPAGNAVPGRVGESIYLGDVLQHEFVAGGVTLRVIELNPRDRRSPAPGAAYVSAAPEDVVVLVD